MQRPAPLAPFKSRGSGCAKKRKRLMPKNMTIYATRPLILDDVRRVVGRAGTVTKGAPDQLAIVTLGRLRIAINVIAAHEIADHVAGLRGFVSQCCTVRDTRFHDIVAGISQVLAMVPKPGFDAAGVVATLTRDLAEQGKGMTFVDGAAFVGVDLTVLAAPQALIDEMERPEGRSPPPARNVGEPQYLK